MADREPMVPTLAGDPAPAPEDWFTPPPVQVDTSGQSHVARALARARYQAGMKQPELARAVGVSARTVWAWEQPGDPPRLVQRLAAVARATGCDLDTLVDAIRRDAQAILDASDPE